ncbi:MAG: hypothetical protein JWN14_4201 [Chthonomonadales bacterium]|nr:hypothetical protein [Chthonomonadales bacterium]
MPETLTQQKADDAQFFERVKAQPVLQETLQRHALNKLVIRPSQHNSVLGITKQEWTLPRLTGQSRSLNVHFEARNRHEFRLELGLDPYIGNVEDKPELFRELQPVLAQKTRLLERLRTLLQKATTLPAHVDIVMTGLLAPDKTRAHTIVRFTGNLPTDPAPEQSARFFAEVIEAIAPMIETTLAGEIDV